MPPLARVLEITKFVNARDVQPEVKPTNAGKERTKFHSDSGSVVNLHATE